MTGNGKHVGEVDLQRMSAAAKVTTSPALSIETEVVAQIVEDLAELARLQRRYRWLRTAYTKLNDTRHALKGGLDLTARVHDQARRDYLNAEGKIRVALAEALVPAGDLAGGVATLVAERDRFERERNRYRAALEAIQDSAQNVERAKVVAKVALDPSYIHVLREAGIPLPPIPPSIEEEL